MNLSEFRSKLEKKPEKPSSDSCGWNPMGETAPFTLEAILEEEDESPQQEDSIYEPDEDDEQNLLECLSLLDTCKDLLLAATRFLDARNLTLPGDTDWAIVRTTADIKQLLAAYGFKKVGTAEVPKVERKTTALHPARMKGICSHECRHTRHEWCGLVNCDCPCHSDETEHEQPKQFGDPAEKLDKGTAPL